MRRLLAVQAQDVVAPLQAIAARVEETPGRAQVEAAFADGRLVRTWSMRGTLHVVAAEDVGWLLALTGDRTLAAARTVREREGVTAALLGRAAAVVDAMPADGLRRPDLLAAFAAAGVDPSGSRGYHVILALAASGMLHVRARNGTQYRLHRSAGVLPVSPPLDPDEALAELATRYLAGHGPASAADLAKWAGLPVTAARRGIAAAGDALEAAALLDGMPAWRTTGAREAAAVGSVLALPAFDELVVGYASRSPALRDLALSALAPTSNGRFLPFVAVDGRVVATWRADASPRVTPLVPVAPDDLERAESAAATWSAWPST